MNRTDDGIGVYIHIPFCLQKCRYCDFLSFVYRQGERTYKAYQAALINEITNTPELGGKIDTIYIGGGTPSVLPPDYIAEILVCICGERTETTEITIEVNPATVTLETLAAYRKMGINRLSFGLQSANDPELELLGRLHTYNDFLRNYAAARAAGFGNISVDLMFSLPGQSLDDWMGTLERAAPLEPEHISAYGLTVEDGTPFALMRNEGLINSDEALDREMYALTCEILGRHGYERYEISNFSKPGYHSRHNKACWKRAEYIGLGLGVHSFMGETRWRNTSDIDDYIAHNGTPDIIRHDITPLTKTDAMAEFMFLGLRLTRGVSELEFQETFGLDLRSVYGAQIEKHLALETLARQEERIFLTKKGIDVSNVVMAEFFL